MLVMQYRIRRSMIESIVATLRYLADRVECMGGSLNMDEGEGSDEKAKMSVADSYRRILCNLWMDRTRRSV